MSTTSSPSYLHYTLKLQDPAILTALIGDPNSALTLSYIPGSAIRGAIAARLIATGHNDTSDIFQTLILSENVCYLNAYLKVRNERTIPAPISWKSFKYDSNKAIDLAGYTGQIEANDATQSIENSWPTESLVSVNMPYTTISVSSGSRQVTVPGVGTRLHQQRDRVKGRSWTEKKDNQETQHGTIFAYEFLEAEQVFGGVIQIMPSVSSQIQTIKDLFAQPLLLGRSQRAGYGGNTNISFEQDNNKEFTNVSGAISQDIKEGESFQMLLTSAYIGRHPNTGQIDPLALEHELCRQLTVQLEHRRWAFETIGSFNRKWRLQMPQMQAVAAGSVLVLTATHPIPRSRLRELEHTGLGERRVEGFGRILFLQTPTTNPFRLVCSPEKQQTVPLSETTQDPNLLNQINFLEQRLILSAAQTELNRVAADLAKGVKLIPTNSLLGRMRTLFRAVQNEESAQTALNHLNTWCGNGEHALKKDAQDKLKKCQMGQQNLHSWLVSIGKNADNGWQRLLQAANNPTTLTSLAQQCQLTSQEAAEHILHQNGAMLCVQLIDAVLTALARQNQRGSQ